LLSLGIIGEYIGRIFAEVKRRPLYLIEERVGLDSLATDETPATQRSA
jgi:polyisoprenyl-phosphate glycosyltransferase